MSMEAAKSNASRDFQRLRFARSVLKSEAEAIQSLSRELPESFCEVVGAILCCEGALVVSGMGKAGLVGRKISASFSSTGTPSHFLHPAEAIHGDLGAVRDRDVVLMLSFSGGTEEVVRILPTIRSAGATLVGITGRPSSELAAQSDIVLPLGELREACHLGLAPSTSTAAMLALGDALALTVSRERGFEKTDFARFHPGGSLGRRLARVEQWMRPLSQCRVASESLTVREVLTREPQPGRRTGAILVQNEQGQLTGVFTDSDLARLLSQQDWEVLDRPIAAVMTPAPKSIRSGALLEEAVATLDRFKISELPVVDGNTRPLGLIDITDVVGLTKQVDGAATGVDDKRLDDKRADSAPSVADPIGPVTLSIQRGNESSS